MMNIGERLTEGEILDLFENGDIDSDGVIDFPEFVKMLTKSRESSQAEGERRETEEMEGSPTPFPGKTKEPESSEIANKKREMWRDTVRGFREQRGEGGLIETDL